MLKRKVLVVLYEDLGLPVTKPQKKPLLVEAIGALGIEPDELQEGCEDIHENQERERMRQKEREKEN